MATRRAVQRLLLVALLALGIAAMHTLGHPSGGGHGGGAHAPADSAHQTHAGAVQAPLPHLAGDAAMAAATAGQLALRGLDVGLDPSSVCLAILAGFALAALIAALARRARRASPAPHHPVAVLRLTGRGPPRASPVGLVIAHLSVLRI